MPWNFTLDPRESEKLQKPKWKVLLETPWVCFENPPFVTQNLGFFGGLKSWYFCDLRTHVKFQNPRRKVTRSERKREEWREKDAVNRATTFCLKRQRPLHALHSDLWNSPNPKWTKNESSVKIRLHICSQESIWKFPMACLSWSGPYIYIVVYSMKYILNTRI